MPWIQTYWTFCFQRFPAFRIFLYGFFNSKGIIKYENKIPKTSDDYMERFSAWINFESRCRWRKSFEIRAWDASRSMKNIEGINVHNDWPREYRLQLLGAYPCYTVVPLCNTILTEESHCDLISAWLGLPS